MRVFFCQLLVPVCSLNQWKRDLTPILPPTDAYQNLRNRTMRTRESRTTCSGLLWQLILWEGDRGFFTSDGSLKKEFVHWWNAFGSLGMKDAVGYVRYSITHQVLLYLLGGTPEGTLPKDRNNSFLKGKLDFEKTGWCSVLQLLIYRFDTVKEKNKGVWGKHQSGSPHHLQCLHTSWPRHPGTKHPQSANPS